ncbi:MAG: choline dehydrogenase [Dongiaceae bacterium]
MRQVESYDYVIVGAGSAGCVLANRLTADAGVSVLLLEAGPKDRSIFIHMPTAFAYPLKDDTYNWYFETETEPFMNGRRMYCPRGRVLGGSSSINGMVYVRGHARDYDRWAQGGLAGWSYAEVLPYFKRSETREIGADDYRGGDGPLHVATGACRNPLYNAFIEAGQQAGYPFTEDMNGYQQEGFGRMDMTIDRGRRCSAARAYLRPALARPNLRVEVRALTTRVLFEGARAVGVEYVRGGRTRQARAVREVILCGGAINSPQLLMLSGLGPADELRRLGLPVVADLPAVGRNLQDHLETYVQVECTQPITLYPSLKPLNKLRIGIDWILFKKGLGATNHFESGGFIRSNAAVEHPNLQYHFLPMAISYDARQLPDRHGFQAHVGPMRPTSAGHVKLRSADPRAHPAILFNYMATENDRQEMRQAVRLTREVFAQKAFDPYRGPEMAPGKAVRSDAEIDAFIRAKGESAYHASCTCKMGTDDTAVVDAAARVRGVDSLRVVDASIMPDIVSGNLNAPVIMLAEKAADMILGRPPLPRLDVPVYAPDGPPKKAG